MQYYFFFSKLILNYFEQYTTGLISLVKGLKHIQQSVSN